MSIRYRLKRSSGLVYEPIPAHPDAIYRPQNRPTPVNVSPGSSDAIASRLLADNPVVAAPLAAGGSGFSPWWIIGPLLALLVAIALCALAYAMKRKLDSKKQPEEENDPGKDEANNTMKNKNKENTENNDNTKKLLSENTPLRSIKPDTMMKEKRMAPLSSTSKGNSTSNTSPLLCNDATDQSFGKTALSTHGLPQTNDRSVPSSTHPDNVFSLAQYLPTNMTHWTKPDSNVSKQCDEKNMSKTAQNTITNPLLNSPLKAIASVPTDETQTNHAGNLPTTSSISPTSSTDSTTQKLAHLNHESDLNTDKLKSNADPKKKENQLNTLKNAHDGKSRFGQGSTNVDDVDRNGPLKAEQNNKELPSSRSSSGVTDRNIANRAGTDSISEPNSPEQQGTGKSPLISNIPTGSKRSGQEKSQSESSQTEGEESTSNGSLSNSKLEEEHIPKENIYSNKSKKRSSSSSSDINKDKQSPTSTIHPKNNLSSESNEKNLLNSITSTGSKKDKNLTLSNQNEKSNKDNIQPSDQYPMLDKNDLGKFNNRRIDSFTKGLDSNPLDNHFQSHIDSSKPQKSNSPNDDKSDESNTSLTQSDLTDNNNKTLSITPNVPQCKTNTSSDDDDYDEIYSIPPNNSSHQQASSKPPKSNSNLNKNASIYRKKRSLSISRPLTKRFHLKNKAFDSNTNDHQ